MKKEYKYRAKDGFSLVELIIVVAIMAILVGVVTLAVLPYISKARRASDVAAADTIGHTVESALMDGEARAIPVKRINPLTGVLENVYEVYYASESLTRYNTTHFTVHPEEESPYQLTVVMKSNSNGKWVKGNDESQALVEAVIAEVGADAPKLKYTEPQWASLDNSSKIITPNVWLICLRKGTTNVEIWSGSSNGKWGCQPMYRYYPSMAGLTELPTT